MKIKIIKEIFTEEDAIGNIMKGTIFTDDDREENCISAYWKDESISLTFKNTPDLRINIFKDEYEII